MIASKEFCKQLKQFGFMWMKDGTTDKVDADMIADVVPSPGGFTVTYAQTSALVSSKAIVKNIQFPEKGFEMTVWAVVFWEEIKDERR